MSDHKLSRLAQSITLLLILGAILIYFPPYAETFIGDDYVQLDYILRFVDRPFTAYQLFNPFEVGWYYRPLQNVWFLANRLLFVYQPFAYYWLQLLGHGLVIAITYRVGRQAGLRPFAALVPTALIAIHSHHLDVVAWLSSIAIVLAAFFTLAAVSAYLAYRKRPSARNLALVLLTFLLTLLSHEEAILLPPLLLLWPWLGAIAKRTQNNDERNVTQRDDHRSYREAEESSPLLRFSALISRQKTGWAWPQLARRETAVLAITILLSIAYVALQFLRPNPTLQPQGTPWPNLLHPTQWTVFTVQTLNNFLPLRGVEEILLSQSYLLTFLLALLLGWGLWRGGRLVRWGVIWAALHLTFIYVALWSQKPELYAGRHIYNAGLGLGLAIGGVAQTTVPELAGKRRWQLPPSPQLVGLVVGVMAVLIGSVRVTGIHQRAWANKAAEDNAAKAQLQALIPAVDDDTHLFANRFPITPRFLRSVTQVWYRRESRLSDPFGPVDELAEHGRADPDFYLLDYDAEERVYNLAPELQAHAETILLWAESPAVTRRDESGAIVETLDEEEQGELSIAGPAGARRLALAADLASNGEWTSLAFTHIIPEESELRFGVWAPEGNGRFRLRAILQRDRDAVTLYEETLSPGGDAWQTAVIPLAAYGGEGAVIRLEAQGGEGSVYWANPRFTRD